MEGTQVLDEPQQDRRCQELLIVAGLDRVVEGGPASAYGQRLEWHSCYHDNCTTKAAVTVPCSMLLLINKALHGAGFVGVLTW